MAFLALASGCGGGDDRQTDLPTPLGKCPDGSNPDFMTDPENCGACGLTCDDLNGAAMCLAGVCRLTEDVRCHPGFFDVDGNPSNGCECIGSSPRTCRTCLAYEIPMNEVDDDCNPSTTDLGPPVGSADVPLTRAHCGALDASCLLPPGAADVRCQLVKCSPSQAADGQCGVCESMSDDGSLFCGQCIAVGKADGFEAPEECFDGIDQDGDGIVDGGPYCEILLANAATPDCHLASPDGACPPNVVEVPTAGSPLPVLEVGLTYDVLYDRYEVTRRQFAAFLDATNQCEPGEDGRVPAQCTVTEHEARLPVTEVTWCAAYDYCAWAGKRLPTLTEFYRAASADTTGGVGLADTQGEHQPADELCAGTPSAALAECGAVGVERVDSGAGLAVVGHTGNWPDRVLASRGVHHLTGNVAEWLFDAAIDWCATEGPHAMPASRDITCPEFGNMVQRRPLLDWAPSPADRVDDEAVPAPGQQRMMCGGGWASPAGTELFGSQQRMVPGVRAGHQGFRCARTFHPDADQADNWPYERKVPARSRTICDPLPIAGTSARQTAGQRIYRALDACLPDLEERYNASARQRFATSPVSILLAVEGKDDRIDQVRLQAGLDAGAELLWLAGTEPVSARARVPDACAHQRCNVLVVDPPADPLVDVATLTVPQPFEGVARSRALQVTDIVLGETSRCLDAFEMVGEVGVRVDRGGLADLVGVVEADLDEGMLEQMSDDGLCIEDGDDGRCDRWQITLALGFAEVEPIR